MISRRSGLLAAPSLVLAASPATALSRTYLTFFDHRSAELSARACLIIQEWVDIARRMLAGDPVHAGMIPGHRFSGNAGLHIFGQASDGGSEEGCFALASRRARAVGELAVQLGLDRTRMRMWSAGRHMPIVPDASPAEPQNRYAFMDSLASLERPTSAWTLREGVSHLLRRVPLA